MNNNFNLDLPQNFNLDIPQTQNNGLVRQLTETPEQAKYRIEQLEKQEKENIRKMEYFKVHTEAFEIFLKKNKDYGDAFAEYGYIGVIVRIGDKVKRLSSVTKNGINVVDDETLRDTLMDLHNYAAMDVMLMDNDSH